MWTPGEEGVNLNEGRIPSPPGAYRGTGSSGGGEGKREEKEGASETGVEKDDGGVQSEAGKLAEGRLDQECCQESQE